MALAAAVAAGFFVLEALLWTTPRGRAVFRTTPEFAESTRVLAANQGVYNGFLAAGCFLGLALGDTGRVLLLFTLGCVVVAGVVGGTTANRAIFWLQAAPGAVALLLTSLAG